MTSQKHLTKSAGEDRFNSWNAYVNDPPEKKAVLFFFGGCSYRSNYDKLVQVRVAAEHRGEGWIADLRFGSKESSMHRKQHHAACAR